MPKIFPVIKKITTVIAGADVNFRKDIGAGFNIGSLFSGLTGQEAGMSAEQAPATMTTAQQAGMAAIQSPATMKTNQNAGLAQQSLIIATATEEAGTAAVQAPAIMTRAQTGGAAVDTFANGSSLSAETAGMAHTTRVALNPKEQGSGVELAFGAIAYVGTKYVATATNIGSDNWSNTGNAIGAPDGSPYTTRSGQTLSATQAQLRCQFDTIANKGELDIDLVELRYYYSQGGTLLGNGGLEAHWRIGSSGGWTQLVRRTNNADYLTTPDTFDITSSITGWSDIYAVEAMVEFQVGALNGASASIDAVELYVEASRAADI